jgi:hypothetical protein
VGFSVIVFSGCYVLVQAQKLLNNWAANFIDDDDWVYAVYLLVLTLVGAMTA